MSCSFYLRELGAIVMRERPTRSWFRWFCFPQPLQLPVQRGGHTSRVFCGRMNLFWLWATWHRYWSSKSLMSPGPILPKLAMLQTEAILHWHRRQTHWCIFYRCCSWLLSFGEWALLIYSLGAPPLKCHYCQPHHQAFVPHYLQMSFLLLWWAGHCRIKRINEGWAWREWKWNECLCTSVRRCRPWRSKLICCQIPSGSSWGWLSSVVWFYREFPLLFHCKLVGLLQHSWGVLCWLRFLLGSAAWLMFVANACLL